MPNTYTELHVQLVFAVKYRQALIQPQWEVELHKYISGIAQNKGHQVLAINGMPDHIHLLLGWRPHQSISSIMQDIKACSSGWINDRRFTREPFQWQGGYGAFSYSRSQIEVVKQYIARQKEHHSKKTFLEEYKDLLVEHGILYDERFIFHQPV
jgi:REP element-mobilizing transposase RayT